MLRHVVLFTWMPEATQDQRQAVAAELRKLPSLIPEIGGYEVGPDARINQGNHDFAVVADFADRAGYLALPGPSRSPRRYRQAHHAYRQHSRRGPVRDGGGSMTMRRKIP